MRKKSSSLIRSILFIGLAALTLSGCRKQDNEVVSNRPDAEAIEEDEDGASEADILKEAEEGDSTVSSGTAGGGEEAGEDALGGTGISDNTVREVRPVGEARLEDFQYALDYIDRQGNRTASVDYSKIRYTPQKRDFSKEADHKIAKTIEERAVNDEEKRIRLVRSDNGATIDMRVYTNPETKLIDKIIATEYGSIGRIVTGYYYDNASLAYAYRYEDNIYGLSRKEGMENGGKRCYFNNGFMAECYLTENGKNDSYLAKSYANLDPSIQKEYDNLEKDLLNRAYINYDTVKDIPGTARIYGYASDEQGGTLKNTHVVISSKANKYEKETDTNGDGYFEFIVPINRLDWYNLEFSYDDYLPSEIDDIYIRPGTISYCTGVAYLSPEGKDVHDRETYLLDMTKQSPDKLSDGQYEVVLSYDQSEANLLPFTVNLDTGAMASSASQIINVDKNSKYRYFLTDQRGGRSDNTMTYEMSLSEAVVKVYNRNGLVASFQVPIGSAGVVWEVFDIEGSEIVPVDNYYFDVGKEVFFQ